MAKFDTLTVHAGYTPDATGAVMPAIYATSTYAQPAPGEHTGYEYSRSANPTRTALESAIAELEGGSRGYAFASGLAACSTVLELLDKDSHLVAVDDLYGGTYRLLEKVRSRTAGLRVTYVSPADLAGLEQAIEPDTKMIWVETPTNPLLKLADLSAIAAIAKKHQLISVADNTFASPYLQRPLDLGFDVVVHSATKYLNGHSDVVAGVAAVGDNPALAALAARQMTRFGGMISVRLKGDDAYARRVIQRSRLFTLAESLGGVESLISQPFSMTHASIPLEQRLATGITPQLVRLSVGIEDVEDLIADLQQALAE
ncbi:PLP-dependent aspartate aminotransferase family protein [Serratia marcescens]